MYSNILPFIVFLVVITYTWETGDFTPSECSTICGQPEITQTRDVLCRGDDDIIADNSNCDQSSKPSSTGKVCPATRVCGNDIILFVPVMYIYFCSES